MAEFLIRAIDHTHLDPIKDRAGSYKRGDIVGVYEDGRCTEPPSPGSNAVIVKVLGLAKATALKYMESEIDMIDPKNPIMVTRRKFKLRVDDIPSAIKQALVNDRWVTVTLDQVKDYLRDKTTGLDGG